ncbi:MAG: M48 family metalloprotease, partial [Acidobacteria bacterium]|nr:M48 family metalloprotease [Acidobacteriota bacterium]
MQCLCRQQDLQPILTRQGVEVDVCPTCGGVWLDKGEIFYFSKEPKKLQAEIAAALRHPGPSRRRNPRTGTPLQTLSIFQGRLEIDYCPESGGIWLDQGELEKIAATAPGALKLTPDPMRDMPAPGRLAGGVVLPNLALVSGGTLVALYGFITLILITLVTLDVVSSTAALVLGVGFALLQFLLSPFIMDLSLSWFYRLRWVEAGRLDPRLRAFIQRTVSAHKMKFPRIGIIEDGAPNAFTYGHTPNNARVVITRGLTTLLAPEELEAVVAHEIGHAVHWDMLFMTLAYLVPLLLYYLFRVLIEMSSRRGNDRGRGFAVMIAVASYLLYIISQYIVLWLSRVREYYADRF